MFILKDVIYKDILHIPYLQIQKEKITCIIGESESGSGKSTLLRMLNDLQSPTSGTIEYNGKLISDYHPIQLRRDVVMLGQTPPIFDGAVKDNLLMGLRLSEKPFPNDDALRSALQTVSLDKQLEDNTSSLSGGEKQRLAFARIVLMDPPVYLLDEPTSALDSDTERRIMKQFTELARKKKKTVIFITHSQQLPEEIADDIIEISKTKGATRKEVLSVEGRY
ncbi:TPA: ABC transporter ATP-binding protein [Bacillus cereus]|nr:ABC transporter ATP-binding protein [Bacillus cereus]